MIKKLLLTLIIIIISLVVGLYVIGKGMFEGGPWQSAPVTAGPRPQPVVIEGESHILFGDLHTHTNYSLDAYVFNSELVKGIGVATPADACDYARYCSALDFWSINDHAESLTPRVWADSVDAIRNCNARSGDPEHPDMVSFLGWEWTNSNSDNIPSHYGHKNVIFRTWEEGTIPTRPISAAKLSAFTRIPAPVIGAVSFINDSKFTTDFGWYVDESINTPLCDTTLPANELPNNCREVAATPTDLYRKLDEWGFDSIVIPHGLAWGVTNPLSADFKNQLDEHELRYQKLVETFSGHGNSELYEDFQRVGLSSDGSLFCPQATENFTPCCQRAGELVGSSCENPELESCDNKVNAMKQAYVEQGPKKGRKLLPEATLDDWAGCGQLQNSFQPSAMYVPKQSTQYNLALGFDKNDQPKRAKLGLIGSTDNHIARPGNTYKEVNRPLATDSKFVTGGSGFGFRPDKESAGFYYTGGLVAVHSQSRHRDAIWNALDHRQIYATSGDRMLVWFNLLNGPDGEAPMGSEVSMTNTPRFIVKALGAFEQQPGCPEYATAALGEQRIQSLCGGECYQPGNRRKAISHIEIVRIRPQIIPGEPIGPLIENQWKIFECQDTGQGCTVEFDDPDYASGTRPTLYYARVMQEAESLIAGDPFGCENDEEGNCVSRRYCIEENAQSDDDCISMAEPRAWTSPIFLEYQSSNTSVEN